VKSYSFCAGADDEECCDEGSCDKSADKEDGRAIGNVVDKGWTLSADAK